MFALSAVTTRVVSTVARSGCHASGSFFPLPGGGADFRRADQAAPRLLVGSPDQDRHPAWSPDGRRIAFESDGGGHWDVLVLDLADSTTRRLSPSRSDDRYPSWHPDGDRVLFRSDRGGAPDLYVVDVADGGVRRVAAIPGEEHFPTWSPDGEWIAFTLVRGDSATLLRIREEGSGLTPLGGGSGPRYWPRWSPDNSRVAFFSREAGHGDDDLYVLHLESGSVERPTGPPGNEFSPGWSPDGMKLVAATTQPGGIRRIRIFSADGRVLGQLASGMHRVTEPSWSPRGNRIAYAARRTKRDSYDLFVQDVSPGRADTTDLPGGAYTTCLPRCR